MSGYFLALLILTGILLVVMGVFYIVNPKG